MNMRLCVFVPLSTIAAAGSMTMMVWLTAGFGGIFRVAYGNAQFLYFMIAAVSIIIALSLACSFKMGRASTIIMAATAGYFGSLLSYCCLDYRLIARDIFRGDYHLPIQPLIFQYHLTFVLTGLCAGLLTLAVSFTFRALAPQR